MIFFPSVFKKLLLQEHLRISQIVKMESMGLSWCSYVWGDLYKMDEDWLQSGTKIFKTGLPDCDVIEISTLNSVGSKFIYCFLCYIPHQLIVRKWSMFKLSLDRVGAGAKLEPGYWETAGYRLPGAWSKIANMSLRVRRVKVRQNVKGRPDKSFCFLFFSCGCYWNMKKKTTEKLSAL